MPQMQVETKESAGGRYALTHAPFFAHLPYPVVYHPNPQASEPLTPELLGRYGLDTDLSKIAMVLLSIDPGNERQVCGAADAWCEEGVAVVVLTSQVPSEPAGQDPDAPAYVDAGGGLFKPTEAYIRHIREVMAANNEAIVNPPDLQLLIAAAVIKTEMRMARSAA